MSARIAVVEDNPDNRLLVHAILEELYEVEEYANGPDALVGLVASRPDLLLLDISLPGMDGVEVLRHVRADPRLAALPVVALTAHAMAGDREKFLAAGFDEYVTKPIVDEEILLGAIATRLAPAPPTTARRIGLALAAGALGFALNGAPLLLLEDVMFVFGGTVALLIAVAFGPALGVAAATVAAARTVQLWSHGWGMLPFALEALAVGWLSRRRWPIMLSVLAYWAAVGVPLSIAVYVVHFDMPSTTAWSVVLKAPLNGLVNALLAQLLLGIAPLRRLLAMRAGAGRGRPLRELLFVGVTAVAVIPLLAVRVADGAIVARDQRGRARAELAAHARDVATVTDLVVRLTTASSDRAIGDRAAQAAYVARAIGERRSDRHLTVLDPGGRVVVGAPGGARVAAADSIAAGRAAFIYRAADARIPRGREILVAQRLTPDGWRVIVEQPVHLALRDAERYGLLALASALGTMVLAVLLAHAIAAHVTRPLDEVVRAVRRLSAGDADGGVATVRPSAPAEIRALARDFNEMAARLRASYGQLHDALCEREAANARLGDVLAHLDGMVRERTADLQLAVARAEEASAAKSRFLAHMSHELRTPLNSVIGFTNILRKNRHGTLRPDQLTYLERIVTNARHLLLVINDILDLSKIEAGKTELVVERVRVDELARETVAQFEAQVRERRIRLDVVTPPDAVWVSTDAGRLRQVLINLVGNAVKFTPAGSVTVVVTADPHTGALAGVEVCDTGVGIPAHRLATVFDAFEQVDAGAARQFEGTGLGLTISRALCRLLGFDLEAHSVEGEGSVFAVRPVPGAAEAPLGDAAVERRPAAA